MARVIRGAKRIVCGMSGGVDSGVSALLLKNKGYDVVGLFMKNWDIRNETGRCSAEDDLEDATFVCKNLDIPLYTVDFVKEYWNEVFCEMVSDYESGITPNPDILCNRQIKFHHFINHAVSKLGADAVATGHYARNSGGDAILDEGFHHHHQGINIMSDVKSSLAVKGLRVRVIPLDQVANDTGLKLLCAADGAKDQTFFLSQISQWALQRSLFPIGDLHKSEVKAIATEAGMGRIARKKESMGICFIGSRNFHDFIEEYIPPRPGPFVDVETGQTVGQHKGSHYWTLGQRCHLAGKLKAYFVCEVRPDTSQVIVAGVAQHQPTGGSFFEIRESQAPGTDHPALFTQHFITDNCHWIRDPPPSVSQSGTFQAGFRFQHKHPLISCVGTIKEDDVSGSSCSVELSQPMRAITPGQFAVFYKDGECLGSSRILSIGPTLFDLNLRDRVIFPNELS